MALEAGTIVDNSNFYYGEEFSTKAYYNTLLASSIAIKDRFSSMLFRNDLSRIIYAQNEYCFKERLARTKTEDLQIPFMNYYLKGISKETSPRSLWNNANQVQGMLGDYEYTLGYKLKLVPITLQFEGTIFYSQPYDTIYAQQRLSFDQANESIIYSYYDAPNVTVSGYDSVQIKVPNFIVYDPDYNPTYTENDWLESNEIFSIGIDFDIITYFLYSDDTEIALSKELILNFISTNSTDLNVDPTTLSNQELIQVVLNSEGITSTES